MKTIAEIASEIQVSKQSINKKIKQEPLKSIIQNNISFIGNRMYVDSHGEQSIKLAYKKTATVINKVAEIAEETATLTTKNDVIDNYTTTSTTNNDNNDNETATSTTPNNNIDNEIIKLLQQNISVLQKQLEIKDKQIDELTTTVKIQAESINHDRKNELAETLIDGNQKLIESEGRKSKNIFQRIFKSKNKGQ